ARAPVGDEDAAAVLNRDVSERLERPDRLAHADAADAEGLDELALGRQPLAGRVVSAPDRPLQLVPHSGAALDPLDRLQLRCSAAVGFGTGHGCVLNTPGRHWRPR